MKLFILPELYISYVAVGAGVLASFLAFIAIFLGFENVFFDVIFLTHVAALLWGAGSSFQLFFQLLPSQKISRYILSGFLVVCVVVIFCAGIMPPVERDALLHHLAVPKWWLQKNTIHAVEWHSWSFYPMLLNIGYAGFLKHGLEVFCAPYHFLYLLLLSGVVSGLVKTHTKNREAALLSYFFTLCFPMGIRLAASPLVDLGLALYTLIVWVAFVEWKKSGFQWRYAFLGGLALGLSLSTKYNGFLMAVTLAPALLFYFLREKYSWKAFFQQVFFAGILAAVVFSPWGVRNVLAGKSPLYPVMNWYVGKYSASVESGEKTKKQQRGFRDFTPAEYRMIAYQEDFFDQLLLPLRMLFYGKDGDPKRFDGVASPFLLIGIIPLLISRWRSSLVIGLGSFCICYYLFAILLTAARIRYMTPLLGPLGVLFGIGAYVLFQNREKYYYRERVFLLFAGIFIFSSYYSFSFFHSRGVLPFFLQHQTRTEYLEKKLRGYDLVKMVNKQKTNCQTYLLQAEHYYYYYTQPVISGGYYSGSELFRWLQSVESAEQLAEKFAQKNICFLAANAARAAYVFDGLLEGKERVIWNDFVNNYLGSIEENPPYAFWKIKIPGND